MTVFSITYTKNNEYRSVVSASCYASLYSGMDYRKSREARGPRSPGNRLVRYYAELKDEAHHMMASTLITGCVCSFLLRLQNMQT